MKVLVCIASHDINQLWCLEKLLNEYKSMDHEVHVIVHSNIPLDVDSLKEREYDIPEENKHLYDWIEVKVYNNLEDPNHLPFKTRQTIYDRRDDYDLFIYSENDHLITKKNIDSFVAVSNILPENKICGFFQYEQYDCGRVYPGAHAHYGWNFTTISGLANTPYVFASYTNPHQACYVLTKKQLHKAIKDFDFLDMDMNSGFTIKCTVNTDIYLKPKWDKILCISHWEDFLVQHLPQRYLRAQCVMDKDFDPIIIEMCRQIKRMKLPFKYDGEGNQTTPYSMNLYKHFEN